MGVYTHTDLDTHASTHKPNGQVLELKRQDWGAEKHALQQEVQHLSESSQQLTEANRQLESQLASRGLQLESVWHQYQSMQRELQVR